VYPMTVQRAKFT